MSETQRNTHSQSDKTGVSDTLFNTNTKLNAHHYSHVLRCLTFFFEDLASPNSGTTLLGSAFGSREHINARAWESVRACDEMRSAIVSVDHALTETVLTRQCADVSMLVYHMRINGDLLDQDLLAAVDGQMRASVSASLSGDLPDHSWWKAPRASLAADWALRTALGAALPAFGASITCRPWCPPWSTTSALPLAPRAAHHGRV